jgi:hypothetical protein
VNADDLVGLLAFGCGWSFDVIDRTTVADALGLAAYAGRHPPGYLLAGELMRAFGKGGGASPSGKNVPTLDELEQIVAEANRG